MTEEVELTNTGAQRLKERPIIDSDLIAVACVRNESLRLPWFLIYHRRLGIDRFLFIDNASDDCTAELLDREEDVVRFLACGSYADSACGVDWTNAVTMAHARDHWVLTLDADEFLYFPRCEQWTLGHLTKYLDRKGATALRAPLLDMYPGGPLADAPYDPGTDLLDAFPYFDLDGYETVTTEGLTYMIRGGPRRRLFWEGWQRDHPSPYLMKIPLVKWVGEPPYTHSTHRVKQERFATTSGVLLHFKLAHDFAARAAEEVRRGQHFENACQYKAYLDGLKQNPDLIIRNSRSVKLEDSAQLVRISLMHEAEDYQLFGPVPIEKDCAPSVPIGQIG